MTVLQAGQHGKISCWLELKHYGLESDCVVVPEGCNHLQLALVLPVKETLV